MKLSITDRNGVLANVSLEFVERRLQFALSRFGSKVRNVSVVLSDENGPRGGIDKVCRIIVQVYRSRDVIVTDQDAEVKACISRAVERAGRAVARSIERTRSFDRFNAFDLDALLPPQDRQPLPRHPGTSIDVEQKQAARILVGLGGTPFTPTAICYAVELARLHQAEVLGMTAIDRRRLGALTQVSGVAQQAVSELKRLEATQGVQEQSIREFELACASAGLKHEVVRESGDPFEKMIQQARYYDLMIFGLRSLFDYDIVNTDASDVLARLVSRGVRPILAVSKEVRPIQRVLLANSGFTESAKAIKRFLSMQMWPDLKVKVITFKHPAEVARELLAGVAGHCRACGYDPEIEHVEGSPKQFLLHHATEWEADAIVVGNSTKHFWLKKLLGETALHTVRHANIPISLSR